MNIKFVVRSIMILLTVFVFTKSFLSGFYTYLNATNEINIEKKKIIKLENKIKKLNGKLNEWVCDNFKLEKVAREDLQMGLCGENIYLL